MKIVLILFSALIMNACACQKSNAKEDMKQDLTTAKMASPETLSGSYSIQLIGSQEVAAKKVTISFNSEKHSVSGFSGCNQFSGNYKEQDNSLIISDLIATEKYCEGTDKLESDFMKALSETTKYTLKNGVLTLQSKKGKVLEAKQMVAIVKMQQEGDQIVYSAMSRGTFFEVKLIGNTLSVTEARGQKPTIKKVTNATVSEIKKLISEIDLTKINTIDSPTKMRLYDGAAHANISVMKSGEKYNGNGFDAGHPPIELAELVNKLISLSQKKN